MIAVGAYRLADGPGIGRLPARDLARRELARSLYRPSLPARIWHDIEHWLSSLVGSGPQGRLSWWGAVLLGVLALAAVSAVLFWLGPTRLNRQLRRQPLIGGRPRSAAEYREAAERLAAAGNYQGAIIERVRAIAADLEARRVLPPHPARTAAELAAEAGLTFSAEAAGLASAARLFDEVRYGGRAGNAAGYTEVTALDVRLQGAAADQARAAGTQAAGQSGQGALPPLGAVLTGPGQAAGDNR